MTWDPPASFIIVSAGKRATLWLWHNAVSFGSSLHRIVFEMESFWRLFKNYTVINFYNTRLTKKCQMFYILLYLGIHNNCGQCIKCRTIFYNPGNVSCFFSSILKCLHFCSISPTFHTCPFTIWCSKDSHLCLNTSMFPWHVLLHQKKWLSMGPIHEKIGPVINHFYRCSRFFGDFHQFSLYIFT